jgi:CheY-like chemotaxis protein
LYFPRAEVQIQPKARSEAPPKCGRGRILIVDDEPVQLRTGRRVLSRLGYQVDVLDSGQAAHEHFLQAAQTGKSPYDLVLLDMILNEELDGLERFEQIRQLFPNQRAIVVSGHAPPERAEAAFKKGLAWLAKPYTADALVSAVQTALTEHPSLPAQKISCKPPHAEPEAPPRD